MRCLTASIAACVAASIDILAVVFSAPAADLQKAVRNPYTSAERKLDPQAESDTGSGASNQALFESLPEYDYLARPAKRTPRTAAALPEVSADGTVYTVRIKPGIVFTPHAAFKGKPRELTAHDYVYSIKRLYDPRLKSAWLFLVEGK